MLLVKIKLLLIKEVKVVVLTLAQKKNIQHYQNFFFRCISKWVEMVSRFCLNCQVFHHIETQTVYPSTIKLKNSFLL